MSDADQVTLLRKLHTLEPTVNELLTMTRPTAILEQKLSQMEQLVMEIPNESEELTATWRPKLAKWWKQFASLFEEIYPPTFSTFKSPSFFMNNHGLFNQDVSQFMPPQSSFPEQSYPVVFSSPYSSLATSSSSVHQSPPNEPSTIFVDLAATKPKRHGFKTDEDPNYILSSDTEDSEDTEQLKSIFPAISNAVRNQSRQSVRDRFVDPIVIKSANDDGGVESSDGLGSVKYRHILNDLSSSVPSPFPDQSKTIEALRIELCEEFSKISEIRSDTDIEGIKALLRICAKAMRQLLPFRNDWDVQTSVFKLAYHKLPDSKKQEYLSNYEQKTLYLLTGFLRNEVVTYYAELKRAASSASTRKECDQANASNTIVASEVSAEDRSSILDAIFFCRYCRKSGHLLKECKALKDTLCFMCFEFGHSAKKCPTIYQPQQQMPEQQQQLSQYQRDQSPFYFDHKLTQ